MVSMKNCNADILITLICRFFKISLDSAGLSILFDISFLILTCLNEI